MSSVNLEGLEIKEATPSIAPSVYESLPYTKKWRILIALLIGVAIIGVCILVFYLSAEAKKTEGAEMLNEKGKLSILANDEIYKSWRDNEEEECLISMRESCPEEYGDKPVVLLVLGGLRTDQMSEIPALQEFVKCGSSAKSLVPSYPSFDYPNLYSIATGLYPESHGIIGHEMYDAELQKNFTIDSPNSYSVDWWGGEPIWNTVGKAGKKSATYLWPGSNVQIQGRYPTYWQKDKVDFLTRIKKIVDWVDLPQDERPQLIMAYYEQPVKTSQEYGPFSPKTVAELSEINLGLDELMTRLDEEDLINCVNIIIASGHGVAASACDDSIYIDELLDEEIPGRLYTGTVGRIDFFENADKDIVNRIIQKLKCTESSLRALEKNEVPIRYHYTNNPRIGDLILDAKSGSRIATEKDDKCLDGEFGYDILSRSMQGVFVAHGPSFKIGATTDSYRNVEIYNLLNHLLDTEPAPNNGTRGSLVHMLRPLLVADSSFTKPEVPYLKESLKPFPSRPNNAVLGKYSEIDKISVPCPCEQISEDAPTHVEEAVEKVSSAAEVELSPVSTSTTQKSTTESSTTTTATTTTTTTTTTIPTTSSTTATTTTTAEILETSPPSSTSSTSSSTSTAEASMDSSEVEVTSRSVEEISPSASSRALNSDVVLLDSVDISNATESSVLEQSDYDEPIIDITDVVENYDEPSVNSTLEGTHYIVDYTTDESENDSKLSGMVETSEANATLVHRLPEPRQIAEIILSHEDIERAQESAETTPASFVTESIADHTIFENENIPISDSNISQTSILPSEYEEEHLMKTLHEPQTSASYEQVDNNNTAVELIPEQTTLALNPEEIPILVNSTNEDNIEEARINWSDIGSGVSLEPHTEKYIDSSHVKDPVPENIDTRDPENVENINVEQTTELLNETLEIPVVNESTTSDQISNSEFQEENYQEHPVVTNNSAQEITTTIKTLPDIDMVHEQEEEVPATEITPLEIPVVNESTTSDQISNSESQEETYQEHPVVTNNGAQEITTTIKTLPDIDMVHEQEEEVPATEITPLEIPVVNESTTSDQISNSESQEENYQEHPVVTNNSAQEIVTTIKTLPDIDMVHEQEEEVPATEITPLLDEDTVNEGVSPITENTIIENSPSEQEPETVLETDVKEISHIPETSTYISEISNEKLEIQAISDPEEDIALPEMSTPTLTSSSEKLETETIPDLIETPETLTHELEYVTEKSDVQEVYNVMENIEIPETSTLNLESISEKSDVQEVINTQENISIPKTSTPSSETVSETSDVQKVIEANENINIPETSTPNLESINESSDVQEVLEANDNIGTPETPTTRSNSTSQILVIQPVPDPNQNADIFETSTEPVEEKIEILPIPDSLKSLSLIKESSGKEPNNIKTLSKLHCPWGFPSYSAPEVSSDTLNILPHSSHIIGFPESLSLGVWTSFTLTKHGLEKLHKARPSVPDGVYVSPEETRSKMPVGCWISDSRLQRTSSDQCSRTLQKDLYEAKNVSLRQLYPEDLEFPDILNKEGYLLSNLAPVMKGYEEGPRNIMVKALKKWSRSKGPINVVHGPVFDHNSDGKRDNTLLLWDTVKPLIPSGYYFVVTLCNETKESESESSEEQNNAQAESLEECPMTNLNVYSFLFPNTPENDMCLLSPREYLQNYMASLADIEEATSLYFFRNMDYRNKVQIRARQPLRTPAI